MFVQSPPKSYWTGLPFQTFTWAVSQEGNMEKNHGFVKHSIWCVGFRSNVDFPSTLLTLRLICLKIPLPPRGVACQTVDVGATSMRSALCYRRFGGGEEWKRPYCTQPRSADVGLKPALCRTKSTSGCLLPEREGKPPFRLLSLRDNRTWEHIMKVERWQE